MTESLNGRSRPGCAGHHDLVGSSRGVVFPRTPSRDGMPVDPVACFILEMPRGAVPNQPSASRSRATLFSMQ
jgi:hypothetical protein